MNLINISGNAFYIRGGTNTGLYLFDDNSALIIDPGLSGARPNKIIKILNERKEEDYEEKKKDSKRNFYSDLFIFDNISGGVVCIWENRDSGSRLYVCMYGMSFRRGCSDTGVSDRVFWILSTTVVF